MLDGVYACGEEGAAPVFVPAPPLRDDDVQRIVETAAHRLVRLLQQRGVLDEAVGDALAEKEPLLAALPDDNGPSTRPNRLTQNLKRLL